MTVTDGAGRPLFDGEIVVTSSQRGAITVYKGLTPTSVVCAEICVSVDPSGNSSGGSNAQPDPAAASPLALNAAGVH